MVDFLDREQEVVIPTGGDFLPTGFIAQWHAALLTMFWTDVDLKQLDGIAPWDASRPARSGKTGYYWKDYDAALAASKAVGQQYGPNTVWLFETKTETVLNFFDEASKEKWGAQITVDGCRVKTLASKKYRHQLHMVAMPAAVNAYAVIKGWETPGFDISDLLGDIAYTDEFFAKMAGDPDGGYQSSVLWQRRAELWKALGEENAQAYRFYGSGTKYDASSADSRLNEALGIANYSWKSPIWARVMSVKDFHMNAAYETEDGPKRPYIPALVEIFASREAAQAAADADRAESDGEAASASTVASTPSGAKPDVPADWSGYDGGEGDWMDTVREIKGDAPTNPVQAKAHKARVLKGLQDMGAEAVREQYAGTIEQISEWWDFV